MLFTEELLKRQRRNQLLDLLWDYLPIHYESAGSFPREPLTVSTGFGPKTKEGLVFAIEDIMKG